MPDVNVRKTMSVQKSQRISVPPPPKAELELTVNALKVLERRYLKKGDDGKPIERPEDMFWRVAWTIASVDKTYDSDADVLSTAKQFYHLMTR